MKRIVVLGAGFAGLIAAVGAARKLAQYPGAQKVPATICAISDAVQYANEIMREIDKQWPTK